MITIWIRRNILAALIVLLPLSACFSAEDGAEKTREVERRDIAQRVTLSGIVTPVRKTEIYAPYDGYVDEIFVAVGQKVEKGARLVRVNQSLVDSSRAFPLRAPFAGTIVRIPNKEGSYVVKHAEDSMLVRIDDLSALYVDANVPERDLVNLKAGQEVVIRAMALPDRRYKGRIIEVSMAPKQAQGGRDVIEYPVRAEILDQDERIKPGMSVIGDVITSKKEGVLALPHEYIHQKNDRTYVRLASGGEKDVRTGIKNEMFSEVLGLDEGTKVRQIDFYKEL